MHGAQFRRAEDPTCRLSFETAEHKAFTQDFSELFVSTEFANNITY